MSNNGVNQGFVKSRSRIAGFGRCARGSLGITAALCVIPLAIATTAAVDFANAVRIEASLQAAADSAVLAAATAMASGHGDSDKERIALDTFHANLSPQLLDAFTALPSVAIDFPARRVHMAATVETDQLLTNLIVKSMDIRVEATAVVDKGGDFCILVLNKTAWKALDIQGTTQLKAEGCSVHVNSIDDEAMRQAGTSYAKADSFCTRGNYRGDNFMPAPRPYCMREEDPLAQQFAEDLAAQPDLTTCVSGVEQTITKDTTLKPGVYCGGLTIKQGTVTLDKPGVYVFRDGELNIEAQGTLKGSEVTLLLTGDSNTRFTTMAGANLDISPPKTGAFAGMSVAQDPATAPKKDNIIRGGGTIDMEGILYFPTQALIISGSGVIGTGIEQFAIFADTLSLEGNGVLELRFNSDDTSGLPPLPEANETVRLIK